jgi:hypothetical protein
MKEIDEYFHKNYHELSRESICELNKQDHGPINNVLSSINEFCYGVGIFADTEFFEYEIFYIDYKNDLKGFGLFLSLALKRNIREQYIMEFCKQLNHEFPYVDIIDSYNTFQIDLRTAFEKEGFFTFGNEISMLEGKIADEIITTSTKGHLIFKTLDKLEIYRNLFNEDKGSIKLDVSKTNKIYLILDSTKNLIKIGKSINPRTREKTLQGEAPQLDILTTWIAPAFVERELHEKFRDKRTRGEWFKLTFSDLKEIKEYMTGYKKSI